MFRELVFAGLMAAQTAPMSHGYLLMSRGEIECEMDGVIGSELVRYTATPPRPDITGKYDKRNIDNPNMKWNNVLVFRILDKPEPPYQIDTAKNGDTRYLRLMRGFQWYGEMATGAVKTDIDNNGREDIVFLQRDERNGFVISYSNGDYTKREVEVMEDRLAIR